MDGNDASGKPADPPPSGDVARDFFGKVCAAQPHGDQLLFLTRSPMSNGCDLQSFPTPPAGSGDLDVMKLYQDLRPSVSYFIMKGAADGKGKLPVGTETHWGGSGVSVAKEADDCLVLTDHHVPTAVPDQHVTPNDMKVVMSDGTAYPATEIAADPVHDLGIVKVETGAATDKVCKPAKVAENVPVTDKSPQVITLGQPFTSHTIYTSIGNLESIEKRKAINYMIKPLPGEDPERDIIEMIMPVKEGFSGAPVFNPAEEVTALDDVGTSAFTSVSTPVTRAIVDNMIANRTDKPAGK